MRVGFIGLGIMGKPMARNILAGGFPDLYVWNRSPGPAEELAEAGAVCASKAQIGRECDVILTMLPDSPQVLSVMLGEGGVAQYMHAGQVFIDMSSINPVSSRQIAAELAKIGVEMLDAPVSGDHLIGIRIRIVQRDHFHRMGNPDFAFRLPAVQEFFAPLRREFPAVINSFLHSCAPLYRS